MESFSLRPEKGRLSLDHSLHSPLIDDTNSGDVYDLMKKRLH